jgi:hypothetical protein
MRALTQRTSPHCPPPKAPETVPPGGSPAADGRARFRAHRSCCQPILRRSIPPLDKALYSNAGKRGHPSVTPQSLAL